jgi:hypothetical protein
VHEREAVDAVRVVATASSIDDGAWPDGALVLRTAPDEVLMIGGDRPRVLDPHAIVEHDSSWVVFRTAAPNAAVVIEQTADWPLPSEGFAQGMVAGIPAKVWVARVEVQFFVPGVFADDFEHRLDSVWARLI